MPTLAEQLGVDPRTGKSTRAAPTPPPAKKRRVFGTAPRETDPARALKKSDGDIELDMPPLPTRLLEGLTPEQVRALIAGLHDPGGMDPYRIRFLFWLLAGGVLLLAFAVGSGFVSSSMSPFRLPAAPDIGTRALQSLLGLIIIATFVERAQHVYIGVIRGFGRSQLESAVSRAREALESIVLATPRDPAVHLEALRALHLRQDRLMRYRLSTRKGAFIAGLFTGVLIALLGPRLLQDLVAADALDMLTRCAAVVGDGAFKDFDACKSRAIAEAASFQLWLFQAFDILVTGGLIGGGAEGMHSIISAITGTAERIRDKKS